MVESQENPKPSAKKSTSGSIDIYAVQCGKCHKWRVINSQEEYEDIRSNFSGNPFVCSRKPDISCEDAADIEYDASRTWVLDKPNLPKTPEGFKRSLVLRRDFTKLDAYYIAPSGKKMRTRNEIAAFLEANPEYKGVSISEFSFHCPKIMEETIPEHVEKRVSGSGSGSNKKSKTMKDQE